MGDEAEATKPTTREQFVAEGRMPDQSWDDWKAELEQYNIDFGWPYDESVIEITGEECWRGFYDDGYEAAEALNEDLSWV